MAADPSTRWYQPNKLDEDDEAHRAGHLLNETASIEQRQSAQHELGLWNTTLFSNRETVGFRWGEVDGGQELSPVNLKTENIVENIGEALMSKAASSPLKPTLVPHGMNLEVERAVRLADDFVFATWRQTESEEAAIRMYLDAYLSSVGCVRVNYADDQLSVESVFFDNIIIDNRECSQRQPPRTYRLRYVVPRSDVEARFKKKLKGKGLGKQGAYVDYRQVAEEWVVVVEAWRLPDSNGDGGYHALACCDRLLIDREWKHNWVPLVFFHWPELTSGFFGKSGVEQLVPFQNRQDDLNEAIELAQDIVCRPRLLLNANSMVDVNQWDNVAGRMLLWSGVEPKPFEWRTNLVDLYQERERNKAGAYSHMGLSEQFAQADLNQGVRLDSSAGIREFHNMEDRRNLRRWTRYETARLEIAKTTMRVLANEEGATNFSAWRVSKTDRSKIPVDALLTLTEDQFSWTMDAAPLSSMAPAARRELIRDWSSRGLIDNDEARRMEENPNLEREEKMEMASKEDIDLRHLRILEEGGYEAPTEMTNTTYGLRKVAANYHRLKTYSDVKPNDPRLQRHIDWIVTAVGIQQRLAQPAPTPTPFAPTQGVMGTSSSNGPPIIQQSPGV